ncbi:hypothetical protein J0383_00135 [Flavobacterium endoglycinae]|uniref:Lipoprotein n=1 Tax=Flavobacterium endoglycinae TaxID=2816357 RepID=A0ABX7QDV8_9FLAO|nr:hypothetical protein [Flavobacterium endoglycinae]QSW89239.1 hypothetical protein J0383_00135 [Flavobacterium endoglycinae]
MMKFSVFIPFFLLVMMSSCESSRAIDFKKSLSQSERRLFQIVLGKDSWGEKKMQYVIDNNYKDALAAVDQQAKEFDNLINYLKKLPTNDIPESEPLKTATIEYYEALKALHTFDRKEIAQRELLVTLKDNERKKASDELIALAKQKKQLYNTVYQKEAILQTASEKFDAYNGFD